ncbi:MobP2 family relaxase [Lysinibacillus fusiformis]|uniref:MobP2 family relaxase n=1 Tax=Lysinibacillus fusiformis TaxID=28031 RepID=UPI003BA12774
MNSSPGVVLKSQFVMPSSDEYQDFINYIDRDAAKVNENIIFDENDSFSVFYQYMDYMGDENKQGALFSSTEDIINAEQKNSLKDLFQQAQENVSPLWQDVISFDNTWLQKYGLMDESGQVNEVQMKNTVRAAVNEMLKAENMMDSAVWSAAIHYNTDNLHVHIATVEPIPSRVKKWTKNLETGKWEEQVRAKRKQGSLDKMKSKVANLIMDRTKERNLVTDLIRGSVNLKKEKGIDLSTHRQTKNLFRKALQQLPSDRSQWRYGYQSIDEARPYIDQIVDIYLDRYYKNEMRDLHILLDEEVEVMREKYGEGSKYQNYKQTKLDDLKKRMGNAVLTEMRDYQKEANHRLYELSKSQRKYQAPMYQKNLQVSKRLNHALNNLNYRLRKTYHDFKKERNLDEFDRMLDGYDR